MKAALIGTGGRASSYIGMIAGDPYQNFTLECICDLVPEKMRWYVDKYYPDGKNAPRMVTDYREILGDPDIEFVFITAWDTAHREIAVDCMRAGKHILLEKPLATTLSDCRAIYEESLKTGRILKLGFCLRYSTFYQKMQEIVDSGVLGKLVSIEAKETLSFSHGSSFMRRWHRWKKNNGGFLNAKCSHDMDILHRLAGSDPRYVSAFGGRSFFNPIEGAADRCADCGLAETCSYFLDGGKLDVTSAVEPICPFNCEKDIVDHEVMNIEYQNGVTASFTVTMLSAEANRTTVVYGSEGTMTCDMAKSLITLRFLHSPNVYTYNMADTAGGHGGGDERLYRELVRLCKSKTAENDARAGLLSTAAALAGETSMEKKTVVDLKAWLPELY